VLQFAMSPCRKSTKILEIHFPQHFRTFPHHLATLLRHFRDIPKQSALFCCVSQRVATSRNISQHPAIFFMSATRFLHSCNILNHFATFLLRFAAVCSISQHFCYTSQRFATFCNICFAFRNTWLLLFVNAKSPKNRLSPSVNNHPPLSSPRHR